MPLGQREATVGIALYSEHARRVDDLLDRPAQGYLLVRPTPAPERRAYAGSSASARGPDTPAAEIAAQATDGRPPLRAVT